METEKLEATTINPFEDRDAMSKGSGLILMVANDLPQIASPEDFQKVIDLQKEAKKFIKATEESCRPRIKQALDLKTSLLNDMNAILAPVKASIGTFNTLMLNWNNQQEEIKRKQRAADELARVKELARLKKIEDDERAELAAAHEDAGNVEEADDIINQASRVHVEPVAVVEEPAPAGLHFRDNWKAQMIGFEIEDVDPRFVKKVFDQEAATAFVKSQKEGATAKGVKFWNDKTPVTRLK